MWMYILALIYILSYMKHVYIIYGCPLPTVRIYSWKRWSANDKVLWKDSRGGGCGRSNQLGLQDAQVGEGRLLTELELEEEAGQRLSHIGVSTRERLGWRVRGRGGRGGREGGGERGRLRGEEGRERERGNESGREVRREGERGMRLRGRGVRREGDETEGERCEERGGKEGKQRGESDDKTSPRQSISSPKWA